MGQYTCLAHTPGYLGSQSPTCIFLLGCGGCALLLLIKKKYSLTFFGGALHQWVAVGLSRGALAEGSGAFNDAEGVESTASISAWVDGGSTTEAPREWVPSATSLAFAVVSSNKVLNRKRVKISLDYFKSSYLTYRISSTWVSKTFILIRNALDTGIAHVIRRTSTLLPMSDALALGVDTTGVGKQTKVDTGTILAALGGLAVLVPHTFHFAAFRLWISLQTLRTEADRSMVGHPALSGGSTTCSGTGILTLAGHTSLFAVTVIVSSTAWKTGAPFAKVTLWTWQLVCTLLPASPRNTGLTTGTLRRR